MPTARNANLRDPLDILKPDGEPRSLRSLGAKFIEALLIKGFTAWTCYTRSLAVRYFIEWCDERGIKRASEVTRPILKRYQRWLFYYRKTDGKPLGVSTQAQRTVAVSLFFRWLTKNDFLLYNPASELELPRIEKRLPRAVLSDEEVERVMAQPELLDPIGLRDRAIMETFYSTGIRRGELCRLAVTDIDHTRGTVFVHLGKGQRDRIVPIGERALFWVDRYMTETRPGLVVQPDDGTLFLTVQGRPLLENPLGDIVRDYFKAAGVTNRGGCHLFRHSCATAMLEGGADIRFIQQLLGHASLESTALYTQVAITKLKAIHTATHPTARMKDRTEQ